LLSAERTRALGGNDVAASPNGVLNAKDSVMMKSYFVGFIMTEIRMDLASATGLSAG
jgi:hypothetical protein